MFKSNYGKSGLRKGKTTPGLSYQQEIVGVLAAAALVFLAFSFVSYNASDSSWFYFSSESGAVSNWCGAIGAYVAAFFYFLFGSASYVLLFSLFVMVLLLFKDAPAESVRIRLSMLPVLVFTSSALLHIYNVDFITKNPGGVVGQLLKNMFFPVLGRPGSLLAFYVISWVSILVLVQVSFTSFVSVAWKTLAATSLLIARTSWVALCYCVFWLRKMAVFAGCWIWRKLSKKREPEIIGARPLENVRVSDEKTKSDTDLLFNELQSLAGQASCRRVTKGFDKVEVRDSLQERAGLGNYKVFWMRNSVMKKSTQDCSSEPSIHYDLPDFSQFGEQKQTFQNIEEFEKKCRERGKKLEEKLLHFGIRGKVTAIRPGPVITLFEYKPEIDSKISKIMSLEDDLAMALTALSIRIIAPIPGRNVVGFEISNQYRQDVYLDDVLGKVSSDASRKELPFVLGVDIVGNPVIHDLIKMPHILVAGSTGSGKSVGLNAMLVSLLCQKRPDELKVILIDPKRLEFAPYADIPHLLFPIVANPRKAVPVLKWVVQEMEDRYEIMAKVGARNIVDYHRIYNEKAKNSDSELVRMPFIVMIIDELADLMMVSGKDVETYIARTAQMARAAGIHMIVATQRPSVDVLTGMIKVNFPARIAFRVSSKIDSRTIIDESGAEKLLGRGDMLFLGSGSSNPVRIHGAYVSTSQIAKLSNYLRTQMEVEYLDIQEELRKVNNSSTDDFEDELYDDIRDFVKSVDEVSISLLQRRYRIGFNRSARLIEKLERDGLVAPQHGSKMRKVVR